jgi:aspartyl-tRNA(Asn)/glutamyl-tRNA(Gln) amidotransferase subunit A
LDGIPVAIKDIIYIEGVRCTAGSKILADNVATYDAPVVRRLKAAGAVLVGTTNLHEFAGGVTSENPHYGPVHNPWNIARVSGGSSGGSAAAVASGLCAAALGTDTAGSVRIPASLCGVVGLKPTYGLVSRLGVIPLASSFDTVGTLTSSAWDAAALLQAIAGHEPEDITTLSVEADVYSEELAGSAGGTKVGVPRKFFRNRVDSKIEDALSNSLDRLVKAGCSVSDIEFAELEKAYDLWLPIRLAEATAFHLRWLEEAPQQYGEDVLASLQKGKGISAVDYVNAQNSRPLFTQSFLSSMRGIDIVALPCTPIVAPRIGEKEVTAGTEKTTVRSALLGLTVPFNVVGFPSISVPAGIIDGLPVGMQLVAGPFNEMLLLRTALALESASGPYPDPPGYT